MKEVQRPQNHKYSIDELMEAIDVFNVSKEAQDNIRVILEAESSVPDAGNFFRYYNDRSKTLQFEEEFSKKLGCKHSLAVNSGTSALIAALSAAGIGPGNEVIVPAYTFFASVSAIVVAKAIPVITEIDESLTLDPEAVEKNITDRTKAIMPVHMVGHQADMDKINAIAKKHNIVVIEDTAQACGGKYKGQYLGTLGDLGCISLDAYKVIGSGEGGVVMTDDEWLYTRAQSYHDAAACWRPDRYAKERKDGELFCGENYRLSELNAAVALAQLRKLDQINDATRKIYNQLRSEIQLPECAKWVEPNDPEGVCGYTLGILFDTPEQAVKAIEAGVDIGGLAAGATRGARDWHVYWNWEHIMDQKTLTSEGCPFKCPHVKKLPDYSPDMCPNTKNIMMRLGVINLSPADTPEWASCYAEKLNDTFKKIF
jgi:dTDP-4-amino-4,6-dideoxygalactose transaminase